MTKILKIMTAIVTILWIMVSFLTLKSLWTNGIFLDPSLVEPPPRKIDSSDSEDPKIV